MTTATVKEIRLNKTSHNTNRTIEVIIDATDSIYVEEPKAYGFPSLMNSACLIDGFSYVLEYGYAAVSALKGNSDFTELAKENKELRKHIKDSNLATRVRQFLSALDYEKLSDFEAKCVLLLQKEL